MLKFMQDQYGQHYYLCLSIGTDGSSEVKSCWNRILRSEQEGEKKQRMCWLPDLVMPDKRFAQPL